MVSVKHLLCTERTDTGHLFSISSHFVLNAFQVDLGSETVLSLYRTPVQLGEDQVTLRDPCPSCHPSYNQFKFDVNQTIIPDDEKLYIITIFNTPYLQILKSPGCTPLSIYRFYGILYILCQNARLTVNYFLARLTQESTDLQWSYETLPDFDDFTSEGTFSEYYDPDLDIYFVYYVYERNDLLVFEGPDNNHNIRFFALPDDCTKVIRITAIPNNRYHVLVECANQTDSDNITSVHVFDPDSGNFVRVLQNISYTKCPIRFADRGSTLVLFAQRQIVIKSLTEGSFTEVDIAGLVYDGQLTEIDGEVFAIYSTVNGLFRLNISDSQGVMKFEDSEGICAHNGCPLLKFLTPNNFIATVGDKMALYSVHPPRLLITVSTDFSPARLIFERHSPLLPSPSPTNPYESGNPTEHTSAIDHTSVTTIVPTVATTSSVNEHPTDHSSVTTAMPTVTTTTSVNEHPTNHSSVTTAMPTVTSVATTAMARSTVVAVSTVTSPPNNTPEVPVIIAAYVIAACVIIAACVTACVPLAVCVTARRRRGSHYDTLNDRNVMELRQMPLPQLSDAAESINGQQLHVADAPQQEVGTPDPSEYLDDGRVELPPSVPAPVAPSVYTLHDQHWDVMEMQQMPAPQLSDTTNEDAAESINGRQLTDVPQQEDGNPQENEAAQQPEADGEDVSLQQDLAPPNGSTGPEPAQPDVQHPSEDDNQWYIVHGNTLRIPLIVTSDHVANPTQQPSELHHLGPSQNDSNAEGEIVFSQQPDNRPYPGGSNLVSGVTLPKTSTK